MELFFRWMEDDDIRFVANSWLKSYRDGGFAGGIPNTRYYKKHRELIERVRKNGDVLMVSERGKETKILGWAAYEDTDDGRVLHYIYVKRSVRGSGIAGSIATILMLNAPPGDGSYSHRTELGRKLASKLRRAGWVYDPYAFLSHGE